MRRRTKAKLTFTLSEPATVGVTVLAKRSGRRKAGRRVTRRRPRSGRRCTVLVRTGRPKIVAGKAGRNSVRVTVTVAGRRLRPGRCTLEVSPVDGAANRGRPVMVRFAVKR